MTAKDYGLYGLVIFGWSTSWLPLTWQVGIVAPEISVLWRFVIAALLSICLAYLLKHPLRYGLKIHSQMALLGLCIFSTNFILFYYAAFYLASGLLAVIFSTASFVNIIMLSVWTRHPPPIRHVCASLLGLSGIILIFWQELTLSEHALFGLLLCIVGTISFCLGNMVSTQLQKQSVSVLSANSWGMMYGCIILVILNIVRGNAFIIDPTFVYLGSLLWLSIFASVIAFFSYLTLLGRIGAGRIGYATIIFPIFSLLISTLFEGYTWTIVAVIGIILVVFGNLIMLRS